ncbi:MAG TPA: POTRA domain-containing protein, partial [Polyangiaceae bacterium]|nr:POTRA domain-containing protein [Polyangiaceae bacterium]
MRRPRRDPDRVAALLRALAALALGTILLGWGGATARAQESVLADPEAPSGQTDAAGEPSEQAPMHVADEAKSEGAARQGGAAQGGAGESAPPGGELSIAPAVPLDRYATTPLAGVEVRCEGELFCERVALRSVQRGSPPSGELVRRGLRELESTGRFARMRVELIDTPKGPLLRYVVTPRRLVRKVVVTGGSLGSDSHQRALAFRPEDEVTERSLAASQEQLRRAYERAGFSQAKVTALAEPTDDELEVVIRVNIDQGLASRVARVDIRVLPSPHHPRLTPLLAKVGVKVGQRLDLDAIEEARGLLAERLVAEHFVDAKVELLITGRTVTFLVRSGPLVTVRTEGAQSFDDARLVGELDAAIVPDVRAETLEEALRAFYVQNGFLDVAVDFRVDEARSGLTRQYVGLVREVARVSVTQRRFPCLGDTKSHAELDREIDGVLEENFPGVALVHPIDGGTLDRGAGTPSATPSPAPLPAAVYASYSTESYEKVVAHLRDLYRSDGYLDAEVGPATLVRRACARSSPAGECIPVGELPSEAACGAAAPTATVLETCHADLRAGRRCEPEATLVLPIRPGPRAVLYDVVFRGNTQRTTADLLDIADFSLGEPARLTEIESGLDRIREEYLEEGYAFVAVDSELELSPDHTRARLVVEIAERQKVIVSRIVVVGSTRTREPLVRRRLSIHEGEPLRKSAIERSQRQVESLGVYTSVSVGMQDPNVPSAEKVVVVSV